MGRISLSRERGEKHTLLLTYTAVVCNALTIFAACLAKNQPKEFLCIWYQNVCKLVGCR